MKRIFKTISRKGSTSKYSMTTETYGGSKLALDELILTQEQTEN